MASGSEGAMERGWDFSLPAKCQVGASSQKAGMTEVLLNKDGKPPGKPLRKKTWGPFAKSTDFRVKQKNQ